MRHSLFVLGLLATVAFADTATVPFGDRVGSAVRNYNRTTPGIATGGTIAEEGIAQLKELGFKTILDIRTAPEGTDAERDEAAASGLAYHNIPIGADAPTEEQIREFGQLVEQSDNYPLLVHCGSANRVGALWAMYRITRGVPLEEALMEARTIGMRESREAQVKEFAAGLDTR